MSQALQEILDRVEENLDLEGYSPDLAWSYYERDNIRNLRSEIEALFSRLEGQLADFQAIQDGRDCGEL